MVEAFDPNTPIVGGGVDVATITRVQGEMQDKVKVGQAARQMRQKREKAKRDADAAQKRSDQIDRNMTWFWALMTVWYFWTLMGVVWLNTKTTQ